MARRAIERLEPEAGKRQDRHFGHHRTGVSAIPNT
jgi:hypothetical protein